MSPEEPCETFEKPDCTLVLKDLSSEILEDLAKKDPESLLKIGPSLMQADLNGKGEGLIKKALETLMPTTDPSQAKPEVVLRYAYVFINLPFGEHYIDWATELDPAAALQYQNFFAREAYGPSTIQYAKQLLAEREIKALNSSLAQNAENLEAESIQNLYSLITYGFYHMHAATFEKVYEIFIRKMTEDPQIKGDGFELFKGVSFRDCRQFLRACIAFNKFDDLLRRIGKENYENLAIQLIDTFTSNQDMTTEGLALLDILKVAPESLAKMCEHQLKLAYEKTAKLEYKTLYGLVASYRADTALSEKDWFLSCSKRYPHQDSKELSLPDLFDANNENVQRYFFYNDADGIASFNHYIREYSNDPNWSVERYDSFIIIRKKTKPTILMYANRPESAEKGMEDIERNLKENKLVVTVAVHRGHSTWVEKTLPQLTPDVKLIFMGSCGGTYETENILAKAPLSQIVSTKSEGTMSINDPLLKLINEELILGESDWEKIWTKAQKKLGTNPLFSDYIPPYENDSLNFVAQYLLYKEHPPM